MSESFERIIFYFASLLYMHLPPLYKILYFSYKSRKDKIEIELFKRLIKPGDHVMDIGANIGFYTSLFAGLVGESGSVHAFEPERMNFFRLKQVVKGSKNVVINKKAVSSKNGYIYIYTSNVLNVDHRTYKIDAFKDSYKVQTITLDAYVKMNSKIKFIKMDIQGGEFDALKGMKRTLLTNPQIIVFMEYWPEMGRKLKINVNEWIEYFQSLKFNIFAIHNDQIRPLTKAILCDYEEYRNYNFDNWIITRKSLEQLLK